MFSPPHGSPSCAAVAPEIEMRIEPLRFQCPNTGREVDSGINTPLSTRLISIRVRCPICENFHDWQVADATLGTVLPDDRQSNDARLTKACGAFQDLQGRSTQIDDLREQLLDELNHRLKNNLQILHGLLLIALHKTDNSEAREVLFDTSRRIGAMGTAQQVFYSVHDSTDVSGPRLIEAVCANARAFLSK
jgi:two-component sensor histidine kinase